MLTPPGARAELKQIGRKTVRNGFLEVLFIRIPKNMDMVGIAFLPVHLSLDTLCPRPTCSVPLSYR
jgi:hypothetical protein